MKNVTAYLALALATTISLSGCVDDDAVDQDGVEEPEETIGTAGDDTAGDLEAAARSLQHDCGIVTCTIRLNRAWTKRAQSASAITSIASSACALIALPPGVIACKAALTGIGLVVSNRAKTYYNAGNCIGIRYARVPSGPGYPVQVKRNSYNCQ
ncbi:MAG: hypothetical protein R3B48_01990 [Kofleriaceae bacterium]